MNHGGLSGLCFKPGQQPAYPVIYNPRITEVSKTRLTKAMQGLKKAYKLGLVFYDYIKV